MNAEDVVAGLNLDGEPFCVVCAMPEELDDHPVTRVSAALRALLCADCNCALAEVEVTP